jgi:cytochrome c6
MKLFRLTTVVAIILALSFATCAYAQDDAAALYKSKCQVCHGPDGKGATPAGQKVGAKDLHSPEVAKMSDADLFNIVKNGKEKMPKYDGKLTDDQIKALIKYVRTLK